MDNLKRMLEYYDEHIGKKTNNLNKLLEYCDGHRELLRLFGVDPNPFKRLFTGRSKNSEYLTKKEIAQVLLDNDLVSTLKEGLKEVNGLIRNQFLELGKKTYCYIFEEDKDKKLGTKYRIKYFYFGGPI